ncbi:CRISPR-associated Cse1 family protein [Murinocardiopsis flavida]|uniref:CRISPR-associated Cse1 family protein n=1 Tax=Murinocardiopsis flavida TaxID=645275 RepID=A0A2P8CA89_9ACTN|nr:type I-E CRISPR-associated protein Cse1/CasA [Murinocardiopsis flavida]PSK81887.1 CRISPR-associated Cse1 family protein [Murinocardiopsis flavida]
MSSPSYLLTREPWIPVRWRDSTAEHPPAVGLTDLFLRAHDITDVSLPLPPAAAGLMRLLYVMAAEITGLNAVHVRNDWLDERDRKLEDGRFSEDRVHAYFDAASRSFDLFGGTDNRPFLQDRRLIEECVDSKGNPVTSGVNKLVWGRAAGNTQMWLSHDTDTHPRAVPAGEAAWHLIAWLYYGPSGMSTPRVVGATSARNTTAGPLRSTISYHPVGANLFETLILGIPHLDTPRDQTPAPWDVPLAQDPLGTPEPPTGLTRSLTGRFRHALLLTPAPDGRSVTDARITWAWRQPQGDARDPYLLYQANKKGEQYARRADADRAIWRDIDALVRKNPGDSDERRPDIIDDLNELYDSASYAARADRVRVRAFGFDQDGQARDRQYFTAVTPPVLAYLEERNPELSGRIKQTRKHAEQVGRNLTKALVRAWRDVTGSGEVKAPWSGTGEARYWSAAERRFWQLAAAVETPARIRNEFIRIALDAYEKATAAYTHDPRHVTAIENSRTQILTGWQREQEQE